MISKILEEDHKKIGKLLEEFLNSLKEHNPDISKFNKSRDSIHNHIYWEESVLFRAVENDSNKLRIHGLEVEHGGIWKLLDKIDEYMNNGDSELALDRLEGLLRVLDSHNKAEEGTIYAQLEKQGEETQVRMIHFDVQNAKAPDGWTCSVMRRR